MAELTPAQLTSRFFGKKTASNTVSSQRDIRRAIARKKIENILLCRELGCELKELV